MGAIKQCGENQRKRSPQCDNIVTEEGDGCTGW
ncbi:hypothetical protein AB4176_06285 [Vibrio splendidus]